MRESRFQIVFFGIGLFAMAVSLRFALGTRFGIETVIIAILIRILWLLIRPIKAGLQMLWNLSGALAQRVEEICNRTAVKESSHATRIF